MGENKLPVTRELMDPALINFEDFINLYPQFEALEKWIKNCKDYIYKQALEGNVLPGYKLVSGKSTRVFTNAEEVARRLKDSGLSDNIIYDKNMKSLTGIEKIIGKVEFETLLGDLIEKKAGGLTLAIDNDPRHNMDEWE
jgi:hypothetical protein